MSFQTSKSHIIILLESLMHAPFNFLLLEAWEYKFEILISLSYSIDKKDGVLFLGQINLKAVFPKE